MVEIGEVSEHGICRNSSTGVIDDSLKQVVALRNTRIRMKKGWRHLVKVVATFSKGVRLDVKIWAKLPEDLLKEILARVPPFLIFRLRCVCKRWNSILQDTRIHSQVPSHGPCLFSFCFESQIKQCSFFSLPLKTWYTIGFMFLPPWAFWLIGSSGGLVCITGFDCSTFRILVCNPLTQAWRMLPCMHYNENRKLILVVDRKDKTFKVVATNDHFGSISYPTEVYDSKMNSWSVHQTMPAFNVCNWNMVFCDSRLYVGTRSPSGLMTYSLDTGSWKHTPVKFPQSFLDGYLIPGRQKRLFLIGGIGLHTRLQCMRIWEFDHSMIQWVEISRMPPEYLRVLLRLSADEKYVCTGQDNLICFTSWNEGKGLLYDVDKNIWSWIAGHGLQSESSRVRFYEPRFDASIY